MQSQVVGARVGNSVAAFAMERLGVRVLQLPTTLLGRRPDHGPPGGGPIPAETLESLLKGLEDDSAFGDIDAVLSGYIGDAEQTLSFARYRELPRRPASSASSAAPQSPAPAPAPSRSSASTLM